MTNEEQRNIIQLLYRGATSGQKGHSIGMALVHKIITLHKGKIEVKSKTGHGTTFCSQMPRLLAIVQQISVLLCVTIEHSYENRT